MTQRDITERQIQLALCQIVKALSTLIMLLCWDLPVALWAIVRIVQITVVRPMCNGIGSVINGYLYSRPAWGGA